MLFIDIDVATKDVGLNMEACEHIGLPTLIKISLFNVWHL